MLYDAAIIGTGPAGVSAALNLKIHQKNFVWIGSKELSDKVTKAELINNYPGLPAISGQDLRRAFADHVSQMGISVTEGVVTGIYKMSGHWALAVGQDFYEAKCVLLTTGVAAKGTLPGEEKLLGRGVSYCATCDGGLYRGKTVAVIASSKRFEHEAVFLSTLAAKVYFFPMYQDAGEMPENVTVESGRVSGLLEADGRLNGVTTTDGQTISADGLFCLRDSVSLSTLLPGLETENGHIAVKRDMSTNLPGVFAAGDCTGRPYQYTKAVGEGNIAAHSMIDYLADK